MSRTLIDAHPFFRAVPDFLFNKVPILSSLVHLPKGYLDALGSTPLLQPHEAKMCVPDLAAFCSPH